MQFVKNLHFFKTDPSVAKDLSDLYDRDIDLKPTYQQLVFEQLKTEFSDEEIKTITEGYRRSPWNEESLDKDIERLDNEYHTVVKDENYYQAIKTVSDKYFDPKIKLKPVHFADLPHYRWELSTSVGAPYATNKNWKKYVEQKYNLQQGNTDLKDFTEPSFRDIFAESHSGHSLNPTMVNARMTKRNLYNEIFVINRKHIHDIKNGKRFTESGNDYRYWNTAFARQHLVKAEDPDKVRLVFGAPWLLLMAEMMFIWPIQAYLLHLKENSPILWGYETISGGWYRLLRYFGKTSPRHNLCMTLDWSGFDRYARHTVIDDIHSMIFLPMFDFSGYHPTRRNPNSKTNPERIMNLWTWMTNAIKSTPLLLPDGRYVRFMHAGIFSGYLQTQLLDSVYNLIMIYTILYRLGFKTHQINGKVQGDDSIFMILCVFALVAPWLLNMIVYYASIYFGAVLSEKKSEVREGLQNAEVLKYRNDNGTPRREPLALLAQMYHPERSHKYSALKARAVGIAYANCGSDPRVYRVCERIFQKLDDMGIKTDSDYTPDQIKFINKFLRSDDPIDIEKFPTYVETVQHLFDDRDDLPSKAYWNTDVFVGYPGE